MFKCGMCDYEAKNLAGLMAHQRAKHKSGNGGGNDAPPSAAPTVAASGIGTAKQVIHTPSAVAAVQHNPLRPLMIKLGLVKREGAEEIDRLAALLSESEEERIHYQEIAESKMGLSVKDTMRLVAVGATTAGLAIGGIIAMAMVPAIGVPFLPLSMLLGIALLVVRKDLPFNLKFLALKLAKKNPRIIYHIDNSKTITRLVEVYNPQLNELILGRGKRAPVIDWTPESQLIDGARTVASGIHVGSERTLRDIFKEAGDLWTAKTVDIMLKDAEQLGELKSTEKLDKLVQIGYIVAIAAVIGAIVSVLTLTSVGELVERIDVMIPMLKNIPALLTSSLGR